MSSTEVYSSLSETHCMHLVWYVHMHLWRGCGMYATVGMLLFLNVEISRGHQLPSSASGLFATEFAYPKHYCHNQNINFAYQI